MNKANLKRYAPKARLDFIQAVTARANLLGISAAAVLSAEVRGDVALIDGREWPSKVAGQRDELIARIQRHGFEQTMDEVAYTWFNRFAALRYMEIHDYLGHGWRVLSSRDAGLPEILRHASEVTLPGLNAGRAREMQLAGNQDNALYKLLLVAQCNELSRAMPFLFERIDDETELLLPENLLRTDSIVAKLVEQVPEDDWREIEVIGWLYQFYISEKKDQVIGKVVKSEDIPAATQLFTPNWIVQYLVQNSVGRLWLMANPTSTLASQWPYYIQPAEQTPEVQAQLDALIQTRIREDGQTLNPETITVLDPACGSGHILVVAYDVLKAIYLERGYQLRAIPRLILERNLYGLDIDDRAGQLAAFALLMKARADDRRLFNDPPKLNVLSLQECKGLNLNELATHLAPFGLQRAPLKDLLDIFEHAKTFGSLIQIPPALNGQLAALRAGLQHALRDGDLYAQQAAKELLPLVRQALVLGMQFDAVVANPPYMGSKYLAPVLKAYLRARYAGYEKDLFSAFMIRDLTLTKPSGQIGFMSPFVWMFISSYEELRNHFIENSTLTSLVQLEYSGFDGATVPICSFTLGKMRVEQYVGSFVRLSDFRGADQQGSKTLEAIQDTNCGWFYATKSDDFKKIPGSPIAYWVGDNVREVFEKLPPARKIGNPRVGMQTANNGKYLRLWWEIDFCEYRKNQVGELPKWICYLKGGGFRRWYGNLDFLLHYNRNPSYILSQPNATILPVSRLNEPKCTWTDLTSSLFNCRIAPDNSFHDISGHCFYPSRDNQYYLLGVVNSKPFNYLLSIINSTFHFQVGDVGKIPIPDSDRQAIELSTRELVEMHRLDWNDLETSWDFRGHALTAHKDGRNNISLIWSEYGKRCDENINIAQSLETANNDILIEAYGFGSELASHVPVEQITLARADREKDSQRLISYAVGCMMGRYSLNEPGLIYAHARNIGFNPSRYENKFPADADGIVPITNEPWFEDDAVNRVREFLRAVWDANSLERNMAWLAESLGAKGIETPDETVRRYLADKFFKDHLQTYKKRPIYWLFSSGKLGAFQALVYLHRYNEGTLARIRAEYVVPLIAKMVSRLDMLDKDVAAASSAAARTKLQKQIEALRKKRIELLAYDEKLRHYADMRITLDLDDGVKVNYAKFGDLLDSVKLVTGGAGDD